MYICDQAKATDILYRFNLWQDDPRRHPFTCGHDSSHAPLRMAWVPCGGDDVAVILICLDCNYRQVHLPLFLVEPPRGVPDVEG